MFATRLLFVSVVLAIGARDLRPQQRRPTSCEQFQAAVTADPNNLDAAVRLGQCTIRDEQVIAIDGDSTRVVFRTNWTPALRALRHAVEIDPTYTRAYRPLFRMLLFSMRDGCSYEIGYCLHVAPVLRDADSILTPARLVVSNDSVHTYLDVQLEWEQSSRRNLEEARAVATRWVTASPNEAQAHEYLGKSLLRLGEYSEAADELERAAMFGTPASRRALFWDRMEALVKSNRGAAARAVVDEAESDPARDTSRLHTYTFVSLNALLGRHRPLPIDTAAARRARARIDSMIRTLPPQQRSARQPTIREMVAAGDSEGARRLLATMESQPYMRIDPQLPRLYADHLLLAQSYLEIGDSTLAEERLKRIDAPFYASSFQYRGATTYLGNPWVGRAWLLKGDVAAARGRRDEAVAMYRRVIGLWSGADADVQPVVDDARTKLDAVTRRQR